MDVPDRAVELYLRVTRANRPFVSAAGARQRIRAASLRPRRYGPPRHLPRPVRIEVVHDRGWPVYTVTPEGSADPAGGVVYAHGGGWVNEISPFHWRLVSEIAVGADVAVTVPIYPLVPFGTAGEVRDRVVQLVRASEQRYGPTGLAGDSAGGQIALSAALQLRDEGSALPMTTLISPALDLSWSNPRIPAVQPTDPWLGSEGGAVLADAWRGGLPLTDPAVSPLAGDLTGLGPLTVYSGTRDVLNPDAVLLVERARAAGVPVTFHEEPGQLHVYALLPTRSGRAAAATVVSSLRRAR